MNNIQKSDTHECNSDTPFLTRSTCGTFYLYFEIIPARLHVEYSVCFLWGAVVLFREGGVRDISQL